MKALLRKRGSLAVLLVAAAALMALVAMSPLAGKHGSLLLALLFFSAVVEGCIAAAAAGAMVNARWVASVKAELLCVRPVLLVLAFLLVLLAPFVDSYPWAGSPGLWLRKDFFIGRNLAFLLLAYAAAGWFAAAPAGDGGARNIRAATYLFVFVVSQTLAAFDLVMSREYPWVSALFGGYFFIESIYAGFAVSALLCVFLRGKPPGGAAEEARSDLKDIAVLMFGFSLLWAGLFFAQYLTIWYGNIPEEVSFIARRVSAPPFRQLSAAVLFLLFFLPFPALLSTRAKANPYVVAAVSSSILSGILIERYVFLAPAVRLHPGALAVDLVCLFVLVVLAVYREERRIPLEG